MIMLRRYLGQCHPRNYYQFRRVSGWNGVLVDSLLKKLRSVDGLRENSDTKTTAPVCDKKSFSFCGRHAQILSLQNALFAPRATKGRKVNIMQSSGGFGKSAFCDYFAAHMAKSNSNIVPVAVSFNTVFGDVCHPENPTFSIVGRMFPSYFLQRTSTTVVTDWVTNKLPMWEVELRKEKIMYDAKILFKAPPSGDELEKLARNCGPQITMASSVAAILEDVKQRGSMSDPRLCLIVDEISKVKNDSSRDLIFSTLYQALDETCETCDLTTHYSLAITGIDYDPLMSSTFRKSGREPFPIYMGPLDSTASRELLSQVVDAADVQLTFEHVTQNGPPVVMSSERAAEYLNSYLFGHCRSYDWCERVLCELKASGKHTVTPSEVVDGLDQIITRDNCLQVLKPEELALGLLFQTLPKNLILDNAWLRKNVSASSGSLSTVLVGAGDTERLEIKMLPLQLVRSINVLLEYPTASSMFTQGMLDRLQIVLEMTRGRDFQDFGQLNLGDNNTEMRAGEAAEQLILEALLALNDLLANAGAKFAKNSNHSFTVYGSNHPNPDEVPFTLYGAPKALTKVPPDVLLLPPQVGNYKVVRVPVVKMDPLAKNLFRKQAAPGDDPNNHAYQFPQPEVIQAVRRELGLSEEVCLAGYCCDNKIALQFEFKFQMAFDQIIFTRRASDRRPVLHLLEITLNRGNRYRDDGVMGGALAERLRKKAANLKILKPYFQEQLGIDEDQLLHIHIMMCQLPNWSYAKFTAELKKCGAVNTAILDGAAVLRGLGPICGTVLNV
eukprot:gene18874-21473_t